MLLLEIINYRNFSINVNRIGLDIPFVKWRLHFKFTMVKLCKNAECRVASVVDKSLHKRVVNLAKVIKYLNKE